MQSEKCKICRVIRWWKFCVGLHDNVDKEGKWAEPIYHFSFRDAESSQERIPQAP